MAKMISELGADVYDDTQVVSKSRFTRKQRSYMIGLPIAGALLIAATTLLTLSGTVWLRDFENMPYLKYMVQNEVDENGERTASISRLLPESNYPSNFRIPGYINGYKITSIEDEAFAGCDRLTTITMTNNIETIGEQAFAGCGNLSKINFSKNISYIGKDAFMYTLFLENLPDDEVTSVNSVLLHIGDDFFDKKTALISKDGNYIERITYYLENDYSVFDMDTLKRIESVDSIETTEVTITQWMEGIFDGNDKIEIVEIPKALSHIPDKAFLNCSGVKEILIHNNVTTIGVSAFENCAQLNNVDIPANVEEIGDYAFKGTGLAANEIPGTIKTLGKGVFQDCENIVSINVPSTITRLSDELFSGCTSLETITIEDQSKILSIGVECFANTKISSFTIPENITTISTGLFSGCTELESVTLLENIEGEYVPQEESDPVLNSSEDEESEDDEEEPVLIKKGVTQINKSAFEGCTSLKSIKLYDNDGQILSTCTDPNTFYLPSSLLRTDTSAFRNTIPENVILPNSLASLGAYTFSGCTSLKSVTFNNIDESELKIVNAYAFQNCTSLTNFVFPDTVYDINIGVFTNCTSLVSVTLPELRNKYTEEEIKNIVMKYTTIKENLFDGCTALKTVNIPSTITMISNNAFLNCTGLEQIFIPKSVRTITSKAFVNCNNLVVTVEEGADNKLWQNGWDNDLKEVIYN